MLTRWQPQRVVLPNGDDIGQPKFSQGADEWTAFAIQRIGEDDINGKALLHELADEVARNRRFTRVRVIGLEATIGLEDVEQQGKGDRVEYAVGIDRDEARLNRTEIPDVLAGDIVRRRAIFLVAGFVKAKDKRSAAQCVSRELEASLRPPREGRRVGCAILHPQ